MERGRTVAVVAVLGEVLRQGADDELSSACSLVVAEVLACLVRAEEAQLVAEVDENEPQRALRVFKLRVPG